MKRIVLFIILATSVIAAQSKWDYDDARPFRWQGRACEELDLSTDQQSQFDKLQSEMQKKDVDLHSKVQTLRIDIKDLFKEDIPDKGKIESKMNEITKLQGEMKISHLDFWFGVNKILKPEQQKIWKEHRMMMEQKNPRGMHDGMRKQMGRRGRGNR